MQPMAPGSVQGAHCLQVTAFPSLELPAQSAQGDICVHGSRREERARGFLGAATCYFSLHPVCWSVVLGSHPAARGPGKCDQLKITWKKERKDIKGQRTTSVIEPWKVNHEIFVSQGKMAFDITDF